MGIFPIIPRGDLWINTRAPIYERGNRRNGGAVAVLFSGDEVSGVKKGTRMWIPMKF